MGGGVLASAMADAGANVLLLEAGPYLFPTHVGNLPRRLLIGQFQKQIWSLWQYFQVINYTNVNGSSYQGAQAFNLGGRSLFWGSLVPQLSAWQLAAWPSDVSDYLLNRGGYTGALHTMNADQLPDSPYQNSSRSYVGTLMPGWNVLDGPVGVQYMGATNWSIPVGIFSSADLLLEDVLAVEPPNLNPTGRNPLTINLNHAVWTVTANPRQPRPGDRGPVLRPAGPKAAHLPGQHGGAVRGDDRIGQDRTAVGPERPERPDRQGHYRPHDPLPAFRGPSGPPQCQHHGLREAGPAAPAGHGGPARPGHVADGAVGPHRRGRSCREPECGPMSAASTQSPPLVPEQLAYTTGRWRSSAVQEDSMQYDA
jgi:hypothetical protein